MGSILQALRDSLPEAIGGLIAASVIAMAVILRKKLFKLLKRERPFDLYLSYSRKDQTAVLILAKVLKGRELSVFMDTQLSPGSDWDKELKEAMLNSRAVGFCISPNIHKSEGMQQELDMALSMGKERIEVIPILLPGASFDDMQPELETFTAVDLRTGIDSTTTAKLISVLKQ